MKTSGVPGGTGTPSPSRSRADVLDDGPALVAGDPDPDDPAGVAQQVEPRCRVVAVLRAATSVVGRADRAAGAGRRPPRRRGPPVLGRAAAARARARASASGSSSSRSSARPSSSASRPWSRRERGGPALGDRVVALVHEGRDVAEQQAPRERRGLRACSTSTTRIRRAARSAHQPDQGGHVVDVLEALADRLEHDREGRVLRRHGEQLRAALPLLPQRGAPAGVAAGEQQRARRALAEAGREQRRPADLGGDHVLDLVGLEHDHLGARRLLVGLGDPQHDAVVAGQRLRVDAVALAQPHADRQRPRARAPGRRRASARPAASRPSSSRNRSTSTVRSVGSVPVASRCSARKATRLSAAHSSSPAVAAARGRLGRGQRGQLTGERADRRAELGGAADLVALPEREPAGLAGSGGDEHPVVGDVLDAPRGRPEREDVADPGLVDHLLVELADPAGLLADQEDPEQAAVGDGAAAGDGQALGARAAAQLAGDPVPHDAGAELGELVGGVAAAEQVQRRVVRRPGQRWRTAPPGGPGEERRRPPRCRRRSRPRPAGPARRAGWPGRAAPRSRPRASARRRRRCAPGRCGAWAAAPHGRPRRPGGRPGRPAAGRWPPRAATRSGRPGRPRPCRCRARGSRWPRRTGAPRA